jgi:hypothetical protein
MLDSDTPPAEIDPEDFERAFALFLDIIRANEPGRRKFAGFQQGVIHVEEGYKARLYMVARKKLGAEGWHEGDIGSGTILDATIQAIEIEGNNLLTWDDRNGFETRTHMPLVTARREAVARHQVEDLLYRLYRDLEEDAPLFERMIDHIGRSYPLLGYLWFLKDIDRFTPLRPEGLQTA